MGRAVATSSLPIWGLQPFFVPFILRRNGRFGRIVLICLGFVPCFFINQLFPCFDFMLLSRGFIFKFKYVHSNMCAMMNAITVSFRVVSQKTT